MMAASQANEMSDEESFVILGTSPNSSLSLQEQPSSCEAYRSIDQSQQDLLAEELNVGKAKSPTQSLNNVASVNGSIHQTSMKTQNGSLTLSSADVQNMLISSSTSSKQSGSNNKGSCSGSSNTAQSSLIAGTNGESLAASFILGNVNADVLKSKIYSQFPSLCSMENSVEDVNKLQVFMSEYVDLKNTLSKVNETMKHFYNKTKQWKDEMRQMDENYQKQLQECREKISMLQTENQELKRDVESKMEAIKISEDLRQKEHLQLVQAISEKSAIIENMREHIKKIEEQQVISYDHLSIQPDNPKYVNNLEHERIVKGFERQLSELLAKNLDLSDIQNQYLDEINCLKVNLVAAEELIKQNQAEVNQLKAENMEKNHSFASFKNENEEIKEELALLRQQVEVYRRDFEIERNSRQNLAGEKDQLLQDLRLLQRKNQELIEEAQRHYERIQVGSMERQSFKANLSSEPSVDQRPSRVLPSPSGLDREKEITYSCPICSKTFKNPNILDGHVNDCLDRQSSS